MTVRCFTGLCCRVGVEFPAGTVEVFRVLERVDYPRDTNGNIVAMVHPNLQVMMGLSGTLLEWDDVKSVNVSCILMMPCCFRTATGNR